MPLSGPISNSPGSPGNKDLTQAYSPLLLATITFTDANATVLCLSTHPLNMAEGGFAFPGNSMLPANDYLARLLEQNIDAVQAMSDTGIDIPPTMSLQIADADRAIWANYEGTLGFKGATLDLDLVLWEADTGNFSSDSYRRFTGICNSPTVDEGTITVSASSKLNMQKILLPLIAVQTRCPWIFPPDGINPATGKTWRNDALNDPSSPYYPCGYSFGEEGGVGNPGAPSLNDPSGLPLTNADGAFVQCAYTKSACQLRGMYSYDGDGTSTTPGNHQTGHFGGVQWDPPLWWKGLNFVQDKTNSGINAPNDQRYSDFIPLVYGKVFVDAVVLNIIGNANDTKMEVLVCFGDVGGANGPLSQTGGVQLVIINGVSVPFDWSSAPGGPSPPLDNLFRWVYINPGNRTGGANLDASYGGQGDPYGNLCVIEIVVPPEVVSSNTIPSVQVLTYGPKVRYWKPAGEGANADPSVPGFSYDLAAPGDTDTGQGNPIWTLMDLLVRANWSYSQLDIQTFIDAAAVCEVQINYTNNAGVVTNVNQEFAAADGTTILQSPHLRYSCSLQVTKRRTAADVIQGVRNLCKAMLIPNSTNGLLQVFIKQTMADQQPAGIVGSNMDLPVASIKASNVLLSIADGAAGTGYSAYDFDETSILEDASGNSTLKITQRTVVDSPNSISANFQDMDNAYVVDSMTELDPVDIARSGQTVNGSVQTDGLNSFDQGQRIFETRFAETFRGNPRGDSGGTLLFEFQTTQKVAHLQVGHICRFSHQQLNLTLQPVRVIKIQLAKDHETAKVSLQWHDDRWYTDTYGQIGSPIYSGNNKQPNRLVFPWQPFQEAPLAAAATGSMGSLPLPPVGSDPIFDPTDYTFGMAQVYQPLADGSGLLTVQVNGYAAVNQFSLLQAPLLATSGAAVTGGLIASDQVLQDVCAVICPFDNSTPTPNYAPPEVLPCQTTIPPTGGPYQVTVPIFAWPKPSVAPGAPTAAGFSVFAGVNSNLMAAQLISPGLAFLGSGPGSPGFCMTGVTPTTVSLGSMCVRTYGPPDALFHHMVLQIKRQIHGGVAGEAITAVTATTIEVLSANWDTTANEGLGQWAGYDVTITGRAGNFGSLPVWNFRIASNTANTLTVSTTAPYVTPDLTTLGMFDLSPAQLAELAAVQALDATLDLPIPGAGGVGIGDALVIRARPDTFTALTLGDSNFVNNSGPVVPGQRSQTGLAVNEGTYVLRIFAGTGAGQTRNVVSNTASVYTVDQAFNPVPDATSRFWIEDASWQAPVACSPQPNSNIAAPFVGTIEVSNYENQSIIVQALTSDVNGNTSLDRYSPIRDFFIFGLPGTFVETDKCTVGLVDDTAGTNVAGKYYNVQFAGQAYIGSISCVGPPTTQSMILDLLKSSDQGVTWTSLFPAGQQATYETTDAGFVSLTSFATLPLAVGDLLRCDGIQSGGATGITMVVKWGVPD